MSSPLSSPAHAVTPIHRVAIVFAGGPAPAANAVISAAADSFMRNDIEVMGILNGYSNLMQFVPDRPLQEGTGRDYIVITPRTMRRVRNSQGILIGTARANPGKFVSDVKHLDDPEKTKPLRAVYDALVFAASRRPDFHRRRRHAENRQQAQVVSRSLPAGSKRIPVVHLPKTIDNDYTGIDFTFGYFTAVDMLATEIRNLLHDAEASAPTTSPKRWAAAPAGWPTAQPSPAKPAS